MFIKRLQGLTPQRRLTLLSRTLIALSAAAALLLFSSLVLTASNLMVLDEFSTASEMARISTDFPCTHGPRQPT
jgi:hypothetical protein